MAIRMTGAARLGLMIAFALLASGCATLNPTAEATETERAVCSGWGGSLPSRSRSDTQETRDEIGLAYDVFIAACPETGASLGLLSPEKMGPSAGGAV